MRPLIKLGLLRTACRRALLIFTGLGLNGAAQATIVTVDTPLGDFQIRLFDSIAPNHVENFLNYINDGDYENSFVHRSVPDFVIQGGGFIFDADGGPNDLILDVPKDEPIVNNFVLSNTLGTVAMARTPGEIDSATSEWFINVGDNINLDTLDEGFTVFGHVIGDGMQVVQAINDLPTNSGLFFMNGLPVIDFDPATDDDGFIGAENLVFTDFSIASTDDQPFVINEGVDGSWENPAIDGQGLVFDVVDSETTQVVAGAWFTYDVETPPDDELDGFGSKQHRWFTLLGEFTGNSATMDIQLASGGIFNDLTEVSRADPVGTATVTFFDCFSGQFSFEFFGEDQPPADTFAIERITPAPFCEILTSSETSSDPDPAP
jgi:cyclophilin family peptidyl-prolyl cis-trans isomerase